MVEDPCSKGDVPLKDALEAELANIKEIMELQFANLRDAQILERLRIDAKFEVSNEWRKQLDRERLDFPSRENVEMSLRSIQLHLSKVESWQERAGGALTLARILAAIGAVGFVLTLLRMAKILP